MVSVPVTAPASSADIPNTIAAHSITYNGGDNQIDVIAHLIVAQPPTMTKLFGGASSATIAAGTSIQVKFTLTNPNTTALTNVRLIDNLPGLLVVDVPALIGPAGGNCFAAANVAINGARNTVTATNGTIPASGSCDLTFEVTDPGPEAATLTNTGDITQYTSNGTAFNLLPANFIPASANLIVNGSSTAPSPIQQFSAASVDVTMDNGGITRMQIDIPNPNAFPMHGVSFTDLLPAGIIFAQPANLTSTGCGVNATIAGNALKLTMHHPEWCWQRLYHQS